MTPFANTVSIPAAPKIPHPAAKHAASRSTGEDDSRSRAAQASEIDDLNKLQAKRKAEKDPSIFDDLIASLLVRQAPAQTQTVPKEGVEVSASAETTLSAGNGFSMEPALLVLKENLPAPLSDIQPVDGDFSADVLAAMTPGLPPAPVTGEATSEITVPVPAVATATSVTDLLTITPGETAEADPRLVACGFNPADMKIVKEKFAGHPMSSHAATSPAAASPAAIEPPVSVPAAPASAVTGKENGIIAVTFTPAVEKAASPVASNASAANSAVSLAVAQAAIVSTAAPQPVIVRALPAARSAAAEAGLSLDMMLDGMAGETGGENILSSPATGEDFAVDGSFDPVEFRIAQRFQNNSSPPVRTPYAASATVTPDNVAVSNNNAALNSPASSNAAIKTSVSLPPPTDQGMTLDTALLPADIDFASIVSTPAGIPQGVTSPLSSPVSQNVMASQSHPAIHAAAAAIVKGAKSEGTQTLSLRLDPPELGRLQVEMKYKKGDPLKVHVVLEKADTASMFQRDAHALENALKDAGLQTDSSSLSFELAKDGNSFGQAMGQNAEKSGLASPDAQTEILTESTSITSDLDIYTDSRTGITHYNLRV